MEFVDLLVEANLLGLIILLGFFPYLIVRSWINPVSIFVFVWGLNLIVFNAVAGIYIDIAPETWIILTFSFFAYYLGAILYWAIIPSQWWRRRDLSSEDRISSLRSGIDKERMKVVIYFLIFGGGLFFIYYFNSLMNLQGLNQVLFTLLDSRAFMRDEGALPGFHFLYFWEMLLPLTVLYVMLFGLKKHFILVAIVFVLTLCLMLTGAKTNIFKAFVWSFIFYSLLKYESVNFGRTSIIVGCSALLGLALFFVHTGFTGELQGFAVQSSEVVFRFSAQFPTFHLLINDSSVSHSYGKLFFLPIVKIAHFVWPEIYVPSHILEFYNVPFLFNLATYLDVFYRDFGLVGVVILPGLFGIASAGIFYLFTVNKKSFFVIFAMSIIVLWVTESPNAAGFIKPSYWFQIIVGYVVYRFIKVKKYFAQVPHISIKKTDP